MKKLAKRSLATMTALSLVTLPTVTEAATPQIKINIDGAKQTYDVQPYIKNSRTLVPLRGIFEKLGATVYWDGYSNRILATKEDLVIDLQIGEKTALINGKEIALDQAAEISNSRTMVPLRFISEALGADVLWNGTTYVIDIRSGAFPVQGMSQQAGALNLTLPDEISTLDSSMASDNISFNVLSQITEGLVRLDANGAPIPGVAKEWRVSADGLNYTFILRDNATWSDGTAVTAHDFEYAWKRTLSPNTHYNYSFLLTWIKGGAEYNAYKGTADSVMVKAKNNTTLEVTLAHPVPFFVEQTAFPTFFPQKKSFVATHDNQYGAKANTVLSNGPFKITTWSRNQFAVLTKNERYWDRDNVKLNKVNLLIPTVDTDLESLYAAGAIDRIWLNGEQYQKYSNSPELGMKKEATMSYLQFNQTAPVLKNAKVRKALTYTIDAQKLIEANYNNGFKVATGVVPHGISNGQKGEFRTVNGDLINRAVNAPQAASLLAEGLKELGLTKFPTLTLLCDDVEIAHKNGEFIKAAWKQALNIDVNVEYVPFKIRLQRTYNRNYDIAIGAWGADYNDPMTFLDMWVSGGDFNSTGYSSQAYDTLIQKAQREPNATTRMQHLYEAEKVLMDDMPIAPLHFRASSYLLKPYVKGLTPVNAGPTIMDYDLKNVFIEGK